MNNELEIFMNSKESEELFFYFKHDGAINFEKKIIAGKILNDRGFDRKKLQAEKQLIIDSIKTQIKNYENENRSVETHKKKINRGLFFGLGFMISYMFIGMEGYVFDDEPIDWMSTLLMVLMLLIFVVYKLATYKTKLKQLLVLDMNDKELLKYRLQYIEQQWRF